jgi:Ribbon-helix-helix protein, copG family
MALASDKKDDTIRRGRPPKSSRSRPTKLRRLEIKLSDRDLELIDAIGELTDAVSMVEVIRRALREYAAAVGARTREKG